MKKSSGKVRLMIAALVLANCLPWLVYRLCGSAVSWPEERTSSEERDVWEIVNPTGGVIVSNHYYYLIFFLLLPRVQISLFAIWAAFSGKPLSWRLAYLVACAGLLTRMQLDKPLAASWFVAKQILLQHLLGLGILVFVFLFIARIAGIQIRMLLEDNDNTEDSEPGLSRFQFSIWHLLWWTAGFAALLAISQRMFTATELVWWPFLWWDHIDVLVRLAALAPVALWLALGTRWPIVRIIVFCVTIVITSNPFVSMGTMVMCGIAMAWIVGTLGGFRYMGYRLVWRERVAL